MAITTTFDDLSTAESLPTFTGTGNQQFGNIEITVDVATALSGENDVFNTKIIGGQYVHSLDPEVRAVTKPFTTSAGSPTEERYLDGPLLLRLNSGDVLTVFRKGIEHVENSGKLYMSKSSDEMVTWSAETVLIDDASGFDTRNQAGGVDPVTGRVVIFYSLFDWPLGSTHPANGRQGVFMIYSDDEGVTWSSPTALLSQFPAAEQTSKSVIAFGPMKRTSAGLVQVFYNRESSWCLRSTDNGITWGDRKDLWITPFPSNTIGEPFMVQVDNDRLVCVIRDNTNPNSYRFIKSTDGSDTWGTISDPYIHTDVALTAAAPFRGVEYRGALLGLITERDPTFELHSTRTGLEDFWNRPWMAWSEDNLTWQTAIYSFTTTVSIDCGYPSVLPIVGSPETACILVYDQDGAVGDTSLYSFTFPAVS